MTNVVVYNEFKAVMAKVSGDDTETVDTEVLAGVTRNFTLLPGQSITITEGEFKAAEADDYGKLRDDGPTVDEFVAAGYQARNYPPQGYASRSSDDEVKAATEQQEKPDPKPDMSEPVSRTLPPSLIVPPAPITEPFPGSAPTPPAGEPVPGIAKLNEAENNIPAPAPPAPMPPETKSE
jgi:hypothetical protein